MNLDIRRLGAATRRSPLGLSTTRGDRICDFVSDDARVLYDVAAPAAPGSPSFERAGPRERIYFDPAALRVGIVTCGGLCPGTNNVLRAAVMELWFHYGVRSIVGFRYGFAGLVPRAIAPAELSPDVVDEIHHRGGSLLGSSRGTQDPTEMIATLEREGIGVLLVVGGDGTMRGAQSIVDEADRRGLPLAVVAVPKTIDNDIPLVERTFGFETAFSVAVDAIRAAHTEAKGYDNGVGLVKLMGRHSGAITTHAALAEPDVNLALIPEVPFILDGERSVVAWLVERLARRRHAVIVVAEGAGQDLLGEDDLGRDASGNLRLGDIGAFLRDHLAVSLRARGVNASVKYIDPSYMIRSAPASPNDSIFAADLARYAVHAALSGRTAMVVGFWNGQFTHVPLSASLALTKRVDPEGDLWRSVLESTGQPAAWG
ncbi:MAG: ATP-dependent 6-phosphofructokinase [Candidatus Bipolaricaulota bacterium]